MTIAASVASAIPMVLTWFLLNLKLSDKHNLASDLSELQGSDAEHDGGGEARLQRWKRRVRC